MTSFKRTQRKYVQKAYRVRNWREYETGLRARRSLTVWLGLTDGKLAHWNSPRPTRRKPGRQRKYSNHAIETTVTLGLVFGLASRQTEGFLRLLLTLLNRDNDVPDHSTISRRKARLGKVASSERRTVKPVHLRIDSSGLSVHVGQLRTPPKARDSRKLHLAVDEETSDVVAGELTSKRARDASRVASLVGQIERPIASAKADAAYDTGDVYKTLENHRAHRSPKVLIPPRKGAQLALDSAGTRQRNRNIRAQSHVGKRKWYVASGYSRRSKVETTFHRYKAILGSAMRARGLASQRVEVRLGCKILNTMTALGIPDGEMIGGPAGGVTGDSQPSMELCTKAPTRPRAAVLARPRDSDPNTGDLLLHMSRPSPADQRKSHPRIRGILRPRPRGATEDVLADPKTVTSRHEIVRPSSRFLPTKPGLESLDTAAGESRRFCGGLRCGLERSPIAGAIVVCNDCKAL